MARRSVEDDPAWIAAREVEEAAWVAYVTSNGSDVAGARYAAAVAAMKKLEDGA